MSKISRNKKQTSKQPGTNYLPWLLKNIVSAGIVALIMIKVIAPSESYKFLLHALNIDMKIIKDYPLKSTTIEERYHIVLSKIFSYYQSVEKDTPEDAVILYPSYDAFFPKDKEPMFHNAGISNKMWAIRFLYPRTIISASELEQSPYKDKITHVAIVNGYGVEYLPYKDRLSKNALFGVVPLNISEEMLQEINDELENEN